MAEKKRPRRTRERILETSLGAVQPPRRAVTSRRRDIADEMNISPGNLYYHFRNKDEIIGELYAAYEAEALPLFAAPPDAPPASRTCGCCCTCCSSGCGAYRFLFRDLDEIASRNRRLALALRRTRPARRKHRGRVVRGMVAAGTMHASEREIAALARNVVLVATYWLSFQRITSPRRRRRRRRRVGAARPRRLPGAGAHRARS